MCMIIFYQMNHDNQQYLLFYFYANYGRCVLMATQEVLLLLELNLNVQIPLALFLFALLCTFISIPFGVQEYVRTDRQVHRILFNQNLHKASILTLAFIVLHVSQNSTTSPFGSISFFFKFSDDLTMILNSPFLLCHSTYILPYLVGTVPLA